MNYYINMNYYSKIILYIILLTIVFYTLFIKVNNTEKFGDECKWDSSLYPSRHEDNCIYKCIRTSEHCSVEKCSKQCTECSIYKKKNPGVGCYWEKYDTKTKTKLGLDFSKTEPIPNPPIIYITHRSDDGKKITIKWYHNDISKCINNCSLCIGECDSYKAIDVGKLKIIEYIGLLYKPNKIDNGTKIYRININNCIENCNYVIDNLELNETYEFIIFSKNINGLSKPSNSLIFTTKTNNIYDINNINDFLNKKILKQIGNNNLSNLNFVIN